MCWHPTACLCTLIQVYRIAAASRDAQVSCVINLSVVQIAPCWLVFTSNCQPEMHVTDLSDAVGTAASARGGLVVTGCGWRPSFLWLSYLLLLHACNGRCHPPWA
jgi:hypothetical protein